MSDTIKCPECKREYWHDGILGELVETIPSERKSKGAGFCAYCQKPVKV